MNKVLLLILMGMVLTMGVLREGDDSSDGGDSDDGESAFALLVAHPAPLSLNS